ncbi:thiamine ABC transporter ATP-binding protein [[Haemophilus] felis]|nr:thiamine ABC transporter ATP-binding protein [[Haemophilus] felis]
MIILNNLQFAYDNATMCFDLHISAREKVAIIGASGAGKSTLLQLIAGFEFAHSGELWIDGENHFRTQPHQRPVSMLFQENNLFPHLSIAENIALGLKPSLKLNTLEQEKVLSVAKAVGLQRYLNQHPNQLSGGQKQRAALARCLLRDKPILLLDEPFSALDPELRSDMLLLINQLCEEKKLTLLLITHQPSEIQTHMDRIIELKNGEVHRSFYPTQKEKE